MKLKVLYSCFLMGALIWSCNENPSETSAITSDETSFDYVVEQFADIQILRYQIPGFNELSIEQKKLVYYLYQAGLAGTRYYVGSELPT